MRPVLTALILALAPAAAQAVEPVSLYGADVLRYRIERDGRPVGAHEIRFDRTPAGLWVRARTEIAVRVLVFTAYRFTYRSESLWRDGRLVSLTARVDDDGAVSTLGVRAAADGLALDDGATAPPQALPTDHWPPATREASLLINTLTGHLNRVSVQAVDREPVPVGDGQALATRWRMEGDLRLDTWYDDAGRWLGMRFVGRDGSTIRYVCEVCTPSSQVTEVQ